MKTPLHSALNIENIRLYDCQSCDPKFDAQRNLQGRTHYVDDDTLKGFKARILNACATDDGLIFWLVESVASRPDHGGYNKRFIAFDLFGNVICDRDRWFRTSDKAYKAGMEWLATFDSEGHTIGALKERAERAIRDGDKVLSLIYGDSKKTAAKWRDLKRQVKRREKASRLPINNTHDFLLVWSFEQTEPLTHKI